MKLQQLLYATKVAEYGTVSEAARRLFVSQPSITASVRELEDEMGVTIFDRTSRGMTVTEEGSVFLGYARQVLEQADLLESRYKGDVLPAPRFAVSCQHYSFAVDAFVDVIRAFDADRFDFTLREEQTHEIVEDVSLMKSEIGVIYLSRANRDVIGRMLSSNDIEFEPLFETGIHVFLHAGHPLAHASSLALEDLDEYPYLSYEQGDFNSFYFSEEPLSTLDRRRNIRVRDRATLFNLLIGLDGYTVCSGVISAELNGESIVSVPLEVDERMVIGTIRRRGTRPSRYGAAYLRALRAHVPHGA